MQENSPLINRKFCLFAFLSSCLILIFFYYDYQVAHFNVVFPIEEIEYIKDPNFLVSSSQCKIKDMDPFNEDGKKFFHPEKYKPCRSLELLTYVTKTENIATLHIDRKILPSYSSVVSCCYSNVTRAQSIKDPDNGINISKCLPFSDNVTLDEDPVIVKCVDSENIKVYENAHIAVTIKDSVQRKIDNIDNSTKHISVLLIGIDSISRLNFIRSLPNTYKYVEDNGWVPLKGYNKIGDNTFPNVMAILTGFNLTYAYDICKPSNLGNLDVCPMLWHDYSNLGYITGYAEDECTISTFNFNKKGFRSPPVDYYFRPYVLATETLKTMAKDHMTYCTGPETAGERIMNTAKDFSITFKDYPNFGFFWMNSFSHNELNSPTGMDNKVSGFLKDLSNSGVLENSIVIFLSDHGIRFGDIRLTVTGWFEERLPFIYVSFPQWFKEKFANEYKNFITNSYRLTSPYDIHMTLKHILVLSGYNYTITPSNACPKCRSLFEEADLERSCYDASISQHWCTCAGYENIKLDKAIENKLLDYVLTQIHDIILSKNSDKLCAKYSVGNIITTSISQKLLYTNDTFLLLRFRTKPTAIFETTLRIKGANITALNYSISGDISRLDMYGQHSKCVNNAYLKKYCYCR